MANNLITISKIKSDLQANINENFNVLRLIYGVSFVLGYEEVLRHYNLAGPITIEYITGSVVLLFLSIRLFWGVGIIRRCVIDKISKNLDKKFSEDDIDGGYPEKFALTRLEWIRIMALDIPALLMHSFLFFILAGMLGKIDGQLLAGKEATYVFIFVGTYSLLLLFNVGWLRSLKIAGESTSPEIIWSLNNTVFGALGFLLVLTGLCGVVSTFALFYLALFIFFLNSIIDFYLTGWIYLVGKPG